MSENLLYDILIGGVVLSLICIAVLAICFHSIFRPDYSPSYNKMPFLWYQLTRSIHNQSKKKLTISATYLIDGLMGMSHMLHHQKLFSYNIFGKNYVFLCKGETAEMVLNSKTLIEKSQDYDLMKEMILDGLLSSQGKKWHSRRKLLTSTFHFKILQDFLPSVEEQANKVASQLSASVNEPWIDIYDTMKNCSWNIFLKTAIGVEIDTENKEAKTCHEAMKKYKHYVTIRLTRPWLIPKAFYKLSPLSKKGEKCIEIVHSYIKKIIAKKKEKYLFSRQIPIANEVNANCHTSSNGNSTKNNCTTSSKNGRKAFMDLLLELHFQDETFTEEDILEECLTFFLGAAVGTVNSLAYSLYCIGLYKDVQKKVQDELDEIFTGSDRDITKEDLQAMKYTDCVIKESNRLYPIPFISRVAKESFKIYDYTVPRKSVVVIFIEAIHRDPESFPNPEKFDPTRFFPENSVGRNPYSFIPFSAGPRNCIAQKFAAMTIKTVIASILRKFHVSSLDERDKILINTDTNTYEQLRMRLSPRDSVM